MSRAPRLASDPPAGVESLELLDVIGAGAHSVVYRGRFEGREVAVKVARATDPLRTASVRRAFLAEATALARTKHPSIVGVVASGIDKDERPYTVLEHISGSTLAARLASRGSLSVDEAVALGKQLASALSAVHAQRFVHRDIKPANILIGEDGNARLIDFGLAFGQATGGTNEQPVGTLLYAAPEQSGSLRLSVDGRADLYSLGVVLYESLAGSAPFQSESVDDLVRKHASETPAHLFQVRSDVPAALSAVVDKLLAKDPDDRYQSGASLLADLEQLGSLDPKRLGRTYSDARLEALQPLTGRSDEMGKLVTRLSNAARGQGSVVVLGGESGLGKTRLVQELERRALSGDGLVLAVKRGADGSPLSAMRAVLDLVANAARKLDDAERSGFHLRIVSAAGDYAPFLGQACVALRPVLGNAPQHASDVGQDVLADAICHFLIELCQRSHVGLVVFEDAQALDSASLGVLRRLAYQAKTSRIMVVCVVAEKGLAGAAELLRHLDGNVDLELNLAPLAEGAIAELVRGYLGGRRLDAELVSHLTDRGHGNPRIVLEYIDTLLAAGALHPMRGAWVFERSALSKLALPEDAAELFIARAKSLAHQHLDVLRVASVLGLGVRRERLLELCESHVSDLSSALQAGEDLRLIEPSDGGLHVFVDERVRRWFYDQLEPERRSALHRRASDLLRHALAAEEASIFEAARHAALGVSLDTSERAVALNLEAGSLALDRRSTREALDFLEHALRICDAYGLSASALLLEKLGDANAQAGRVEDAVALFQRAGDRSEDRVTRASLQLRIAELYITAHFDTTSAETHLLRAWQQLGHTLPKNQPSSAFWFVFYAVLSTVMDLTGLGVGGAEDKRLAKVTYQIFESTTKWAYLSNRFFTLIALSFRCFYAGLRVGQSRELAYAFGTHSATLANMGLPERWSDSYIAKARKTAKTLGDRTAEVRVEYWDRVACSQRGRLVEYARTLDALLAKDGRWFEASDLFFAYIDLSLSYQLRGYHATGAGVMRRCLAEVAAKAGADASQARACREMIESGESLFTRPGESTLSANERNARPMDPERDSFMWFQNWSIQLGIRYETQDYEGFDHAIEQADRAGRDPMTAGWQFSLYWVTKGYARLEQCFLASASERPRRVEQLKQVIHELRFVEKIELYRMHRRVLQACVLHFMGKQREAFGMIANAEQLAVTNDSPQGLYDCLRTRARIALELGEREAAARDFSLAHCIAETNGWVHRARQLKKAALEGSVASRSRNSSSTMQALARTSEGTMAHGQASDTRLRRDRNALVDVSLATAHVLEPAAQAEVALDKLLSLLGGERAFLFLWREEASELECVAGRGARGRELGAAPEFPRSVVTWVREHRAAIVVNGFDEAARLGSDTAVRLGLRSIIAAPVMLRDRLSGVVYLDSAATKGVFTEDDIEILGAVAHQIAVSQETARSAQREIERRELEKDLQLTAAVQGLLLPKHDVLWSGDVEAVGSFEPATHAGGDFWYADALPSRALRVLVGDVTGHGAGAAMVTAVMAGCYRGVRVNHPDAGTAELLETMNRTLREACEGRYTLPLSALEIDPDTGVVSWWNAAAPPILKLSMDGQVESLSEKGLPLGSEDFSCGMRTLTLQPGERLLVFTDGMSELELPGGRQLGLRRLSDMLRATHGMALQQAREHLVMSMKAASGGIQRSDDVTFVIIGRK